jgi:hypothetical protein
VLWKGRYPQVACLLRPKQQPLLRTQRAQELWTMQSRLQPPSLQELRRGPWLKAPYRQGQQCLPFERPCLQMTDCYFDLLQKGCCPSS